MTSHMISISKSWVIMFSYDIQFVTMYVLDSDQHAVFILKIYLI